MSPSASNIDTKFYRKSISTPYAGMELDAETARVFDLIDEKTQLSKVAEHARINAAALWKAIAKLTRMGLIEEAGSSAGHMGRPFLEGLQRELTRAVGPIGQILLKNTAARMDITLPNIPVERARELIYKLVDQIPDKKAGAEFQHNMFKII